MGKLVLEKLCVGYAAQTLVNEISLSVENGEMLSVLGPSGEGKTTLLKTIAGLQPALSGSIFINEQPVTTLPPEQRDIVLIFQKPLLFPYLNVADNIGFGLRMQGIGHRKARSKIGEMVELTGLAGLEKRKIHQLSGGQQQRVALARGLVLRPAVLLLDEPLSNLDADLRQQMRELISHIREQTKTTMVFVTHDQSEALMLSDKVALLLNKQIMQHGTPQELFYHPRTAEVAQFFGCSNLLEGEIRDNCFFAGRFQLSLAHPEVSRCTVAIRPEKITIKTSSTPHAIKAKVRSTRFEGTQTKLLVDTEAGALTVIANHSTAAPGETVYLRIPDEAIHVIPPQQEQRS